MCKADALVQGEAPNSLILWSTNSRTIRGVYVENNSNKYFIIFHELCTCYKPRKIICFVVDKVTIFIVACVYFIANKL